MRRFAAVLCAGLALAVLATPVAAAGSGIHGHIWNVTCPGPCSPNTEPRPFEGEVKVVIRTAPEGVRVARFRAEGPDFKAPLPPGTYRVRVIPYPQSSCWQGDHHRATVPPDAFVSVDFYVSNGCIV